MRQPFITKRVNPLLLQGQTYFPYKTRRIIMSLEDLVKDGIKNIPAYIPGDTAESVEKNMESHLKIF